MLKLSSRFVEFRMSLRLSWIDSSTSSLRSVFDSIIQSYFNFIWCLFFQGHFNFIHLQTGDDNIFQSSDEAGFYEVEEECQI